MVRLVHLVEVGVSRMVDLKIEATLAAKNQGAESLQQRRDRGRSDVGIEVLSDALLKGKENPVNIYVSDNRGGRCFLRQSRKLFTVLPMGR